MERAQAGLPALAARQTGNKFLISALGGGVNAEHSPNTGRAFRSQVGQERQMSIELSIFHLYWNFYIEVKFEF